MQQEQLRTQPPTSGRPPTIAPRGCKFGHFFSQTWRRVKSSAEVWLVGGLTATVLLFSSSGIPMVWDEGNAIWRAEGISAWFSKLITTPPAGWPEIFSRDYVRFYWRYTITLEGHPSFYGILIAAGRGLAGTLWPPWQQARLGPIMVFALAVAGVYWRVRDLRGKSAALASVIGICLIPQVLAHVQFATPDSPLCSLWLLTWACFPCRGNCFPSGRPIGTSEPSAFRALPLGRALRDTVISYTLFGILMGLTLASKFTGWLSPLPYLVYVLLLERTSCRLRGLFYAFGVALVVFLAANPPIWHEPTTGLVEFLKRNLDRSAYNVSIFFLGRRYDLNHPLPWYNTLVWIGVGIPIFVLICTFFGGGLALRRAKEEPWLLLVLMHGLILLIVRAMPFAPPHDGLRLFLPSVAFLGILAGLGADGILRAIRDGLPSRLERVPRVYLVGQTLLALAFLVGGGVASLRNLICYYPHWLSFYNGLIGGPIGAFRAGLEPTYYWDALTPEVIDWLGSHTGKNEKVCFSAGPYENLVLLRRWGLLPFEFQPEAPGEYRWYVIQYRFGVWQPEDWWLAHHKQPVYTKWLFENKVGCGKRDIPLLSIYTMEDYLEARQAVNEAASSTLSEEENHP
jgi:hypothetical protein